MSHRVKLGNRWVVDIMVDGVDTKDAPDFADAFICDATWEATGYPLDEMDIYKLQDENTDLVHDLAWESLH